MKDIFNKNTIKSISTALLILLIFFNGTAQEDSTKQIIQFSGLITTSDSLYPKPIPFATIKIKNTYRGTIASMDGFFSLAVNKTDTIEFSAIGFKKVNLFIPDYYDKQSLNVIVEMPLDTFEFSEALIYPWPSPDKFKEAFLALEVEKDYVDIAMENLSQQKIMALMMDLPMDGGENQQLYLNQMAVRAGYLGGQTNFGLFGNTPVPLSLLNPAAWMEFFRYLKEGKFKDPYKEYR